MAKWRVWNMHPQGMTHNEEFKGEMITIKAGEYFLMDYEDAVQFRGKYFPIKLDAMGQQDPATYKVIKLEQHDAQEAQTDKQKVYVCHMDGKEFNSKQELAAYEQSKYGDVERVIDDVLDDELAQTVTPEKRKPGRPPREKTL